MPKASLVLSILGCWFVFITSLAYRDFRRSSITERDIQTSSTSQLAIPVNISCTTKSSPRLLSILFRTEQVPELVEKIGTSMGIVPDPRKFSTIKYKKDEIALLYSFDVEAPRSYQEQVVNMVNRHLGTHCVLDE